MQRFHQSQEIAEMNAAESMRAHIEANIGNEQNRMTCASAHTCTRRREHTSDVGDRMRAWTMRDGRVRGRYSEMFVVDVLPSSANSFVREIELDQSLIAKLFQVIDFETLRFLLQYLPADLELPKRIEFAIFKRFYVRVHYEVRNPVLVKGLAFALECFFKEYLQSS